MIAHIIASPSALGVAALAPALLILWLVAATDHRPEPPLRILAAFCLGICAIFLARLLRFPIQSFLNAPVTNAWMLAVQKALFVAALPEELAKVSLLALVLSLRRSADEPMDGVVYGAAVGLGFAAWENLGYFLRHADDWRLLAIMRNVLTTPFHCALGVIAGAWLAAARHVGALGRRHVRGRRARLITSAFVVPVALHALFDLPVLALHNNATGSEIGRAVLQMSALVIGFGVVAVAVREATDLSQRQKVSRRLALLASDERAILAFVLVGALASVLGAWLVAAWAGARWGASPNVLSNNAPGLGAILLLVALAAFAVAARRLKCRTSQPGELL